MRCIGLALLLLAAEAAAHGGYFPHGGARPQLPSPAVEPPPPLPVTPRGEIVETHRWPDFAKVQFAATYREPRPRSVLVGPLFGVTGVHEHARFLQPTAPGKPPLAWVDATITGLRLAPPRKRGAPRLYRSEGRVLVVRDLKEGEEAPDARFVDPEHRRALTFLSLEEARRRHRVGVRQALQLPGLPALEKAATSR